MFAQARLPIAPLGTTHADCFACAVPVTRQLTIAEVRQDYEGNTGQVIIERFSEMDPLATPAVLVPGHAPFTWGVSAEEAVDSAVALEAVARMAMGTWRLKPDAIELEDYVLNKHRQRKHGPDAYYGQR